MNIQRLYNRDLRGCVAAVSSGTSDFDLDFPCGSGWTSVGLAMESKQAKEASSVTSSQPAPGLDVESQPLREASRAVPHTINNFYTKLRQVIDTIPALTWSNLADGSNGFLHERWHYYTGLSEGESHEWAWHAAVHPEDLPSLMEKWRTLLASGEPGEINARLRRRDGVDRLFLISAEPFLDETGQLVRWYGTSIDIEDRKRAEQKLFAEIAERERAEESLKLQVDILQHLPDVSWTERIVTAVATTLRRLQLALGVPGE